MSKEIVRRPLGIWQQRLHEFLAMTNIKTHHVLKLDASLCLPTVTRTESWEV